MDASVPSKRGPPDESPERQTPSKHQGTEPSAAASPAAAEPSLPVASPITAALSAEAQAVPSSAMGSSSSVQGPSSDGSSPSTGAPRVDTRRQGKPPKVVLSEAEARASVAGASASPDYYKNAQGYSAEENHDLEDIYRAWDNLVPAENWPLIEAYVKGLLARKVKTPKDLTRAMGEINKELKGRRTAGGHQDVPRKSDLNHVYTMLVSRGEATDDPDFQRLLVKKASKSLSGVLVVTVLTSPYPKVGVTTQKFSCEWWVLSPDP